MTETVVPTITELPKNPSFLKKNWKAASAGIVAGAVAVALLVNRSRKFEETVSSEDHTDV